MIAALLLATTAPMTPVEAERAFAADAQTLGQWTAFRKWAAPDAIMFDPQPVKTHQLLKDAKNPPKSIDWWPTASYISCDGTMAVNTGGWRRPDGTVGYFTTVWRKGSDDWRWTVDGGDATPGVAPRSRAVKVERAACPGRYPAPWGAVESFRTGTTVGQGESRDYSLHYHWIAEPDGGRRFQAVIRRASGDAVVIDDVIAAPESKPQ